MMVNMSKKTLITIFGAIIILLPFLGLPNSISTPIFVLVGVGIIFIARTGTRKKIIPQV
jgi:VIT1/CCC1 family predicted Fe2+/Mn2+ transporter